MLGVLRHIKEVHPFFQTTVVCGLEGCVATPSSFQALRTHLYRKHRDLLEVQDHQTEDVATPTEDEDQNVPTDQELEQEEIANEPPSPHAPKSTILGAEFIMKVRDGKGLTQVATDGIVQDTKIVLQNTLDSVREKLLEKLGNLPHSLTEDQLEDLMSVFSDGSVQDPFRGLESVYKQDKFIYEHFNYVVGIESVMTLELAGMHCHGPISRSN